MSEFLIIQVGQCGNQIGSALWPLILEEYNIKPNENWNNNINHKSDVQNSFTSFFQVRRSRKSSPSQFSTLNDLVSNNVKARVICIDMEDTVLARFKLGPLRGIFDKKCFVTNYPGSGNNWAQGFHEHGPAFQNEILKAIQYVVERCDSLHGFILLFSTGGGTGSGLGSFILKLLSDFYPKVERFVSCVYPIGTEDVITCPYNMGFTSQELIENATCVFPVENRALLNIAQRINANTKIKSNQYVSRCMSFEDMNNIIVNKLLHLTSGSRFAGSLNFDMNELNTNMVPFPKLHFLSSGFSPFPYNNLNKNGNVLSKQVKSELFLASCNRLNQLIKVDPLGPKSVLLGSTIIGRGAYTMSDMRSYVEKIQNKSRFTPWSSKSVKVGLCNVAPYNSSLGLFSMFNSSSMVNLFEHVDSQFSKLYHKRAHVHHYTKIPSFDPDDFSECHNTLREIIELYKDIELMKPINVPRLSPM